VGVLSLVFIVVSMVQRNWPFWVISFASFLVRVISKMPLLACVAFFIGARVWASAKLRRLFSSLLVGEEHKIIVFKDQEREKNELFQSACPRFGGNIRPLFQLSLHALASASKVHFLSMASLLFS
jgi:hypothetical protein